REQELSAFAALRPVARALRGDAVHGIAVRTDDVAHERSEGVTFHAHGSALPGFNRARPVVALASNTGGPTSVACSVARGARCYGRGVTTWQRQATAPGNPAAANAAGSPSASDRKSTRLNSSHVKI